MKKIIIIVLSFILIIIFALGIIFIKDLQFFFAKNNYSNGNYTEAINGFAGLDDKTKIEFAKENKSGDSNFIINLLYIIENPEYSKAKIDIYLDVIKNSNIDNAVYQKIYNDIKEIDKNFEYESTKEIIYRYAKELVIYYEANDDSVTDYQNIIDELMSVSNTDGVTELINRCNENIAKIYIKFAEKYCSQTLYVDSITYYHKAIATLEQLNDSKYDEKIYKCKDEIKEVEKLSKTFIWCEAYGCARHKAPGEEHYCSIHLKDPTATTPVATEKKKTHLDILIIINVSILDAQIMRRLVNIAQNIQHTINALIQVVTIL